MGIETQSELPDRIPLTPEQILLSAFTYFQTESLDLQSLINVGVAAQLQARGVDLSTISNEDFERLAGNAQGVLARLVDTSLLRWWKDENGMVYFSPIERDLGDL